MYFWNQNQFWTPYTYIIPQNQIFESNDQSHMNAQSNQILNSVNSIPNQPPIPINQHVQDNGEPLKQANKSKRKRKEKEQEEKEIKISRNTKSLIIRQFVRCLNRDASKIIEIKAKINSNFSIKRFLKIVQDKIPIGKQKYIKARILQELCHDSKEHQFSLIMRILLKDFLYNDFELQVLNKKKNKGEYLKGRRELYKRIFQDYCIKDSE